MLYQLCGAPLDAACWLITGAAGGAGGDGGAGGAGGDVGCCGGITVVVCITGAGTGRSRARLRCRHSAGGVSMITRGDEAVASHQRVAEAMWREALKGPAAAARMRGFLGAAKAA